MKKFIYNLLIFLLTACIQINAVVKAEKEKNPQSTKIELGEKNKIAIKQNPKPNHKIPSLKLLGDSTTLKSSDVDSDIKIDTIKLNSVQSEQDKSQAKQKKIIILSSKGGGGHTAVSNAIKGYLKNIYDITSYNLFHEVIQAWDTINVITFGRLSGEDFYNFCLQCRWTGMANRYLKAGIGIINFRQDYVRTLITEFIQKHKPDLIISVIPIINYIVLQVAKEHNIPFLVVTNDLDTSNYVNQLKNPNYKKLFYTLAFEDDQMRKKIAEANIPEKQIKITGFPLRPEFFTPKDRPSIRKVFNIPDNKPVIMILMGGTGSLATLRFVKILASIATPMHVIVCLGRNEKLRRNINRIILPEHVTLSVIGFTDKIADLMSVSDLLITKPGPGSVCEAIASQLPMILDMTNTPCFWELMNVEFAQKHKFGEVLNKFSDLKKILPKYIKDKKYTTKIKKRMANFKKENFESSIKKIIEELLALKD